jgi:hypothetical protein
MPPVTPIAVVAVVAVVAVLFLILQTAQGRADNVSNSSPNPNYPPPPSVDSFFDAAIDFLSVAIAGAEGFGKAGTIPTRANNPGDLVIPNWQGSKLGSEGISVFASPLEGWNRLKFQLYLIGSEQSHVYNLDMTIADMAAKWTRTDPGIWATNVARSIPTQTDTTLRQLFTGTFA